jgi:hypothetical protein
MSYDHPAYTNVDTVAVGAIAASANSAGNKYAAFTARLIKSVVLKPTTAPGSSDVISLLQISGTTTTTTAIATIGSGVSTFQQALPTSTNLAIATLAQGDTYYIQKGTDTSSVYIGEIEMVTVPGANVTK